MYGKIIIHFILFSNILRIHGIIFAGLAELSEENTITCGVSQGSVLH